LCVVYSFESIMKVLNCWRDVCTMCLGSDLRFAEAVANALD
jgi:hypothetical protein